MHRANKTFSDFHAEAAIIKKKNLEVPYTIGFINLLYMISRTGLGSSELHLDSCFSSAVGFCLNCCIIQSMSIQLSFLLTKLTV